MPPEMITAMYLYVYTLTPSDSAATGFSPQERSRRPKAVFHRTKNVTTKRTTATIVSSDTLVTSPPRTPARSETKNQWCFSTLCSQSERPGIVTEVMSSAGGDCLGEPPLTAASPELNQSLAK